jgi:hypothetical protein
LRLSSDIQLLSSLFRLTLEAHSNLFSLTLSIQTLSSIMSAGPLAKGFYVLNVLRCCSILSLVMSIAASFMVVIKSFLMTKVGSALLLGVCSLLVLTQ